MTVYLDSSALVKLVQVEDESRALRTFLRARPAEPRVTSALARVEVVRAVLPGGAAAMAAARRLLDRLHEVPLDRELIDRAGTVVSPVPLRSLDAIHLVSALRLASTLTALVTYDTRMGLTAEALGLLVTAPA